MKTKLLLLSVAIISTVAVIAGIDYVSNTMPENIPVNTYCEIVRDWEKVLC